MKKIFFTTVVLSLFAGNAYANISTNGCEIKKQNIQKQMEYAKAHGNHHRLQGLERALENVERYCTPDKVVENTRHDIREKQRDIKERELELKEAQLKGDTDKIAKQKRKLAEAQAELKELESELNLLIK